MITDVHLFLGVELLVRWCRDTQCRTVNPNIISANCSIYRYCHYQTDINHIIFDKMQYMYIYLRAKYHRHWLSDTQKIQLPTNHNVLKNIQLPINHNALKNIQFCDLDSDCQGQVQTIMLQTIRTQFWV